MDLFVYGTLMAPQLFAAVSGLDGAKDQSAELSGFEVRRIAGNVVPTICAADGSVNGVLWTGLDEAAIQRLDLYERAFGYTPQKVNVTVNGQAHSVLCYMPPAGQEVLEQPWRLKDWETDHLRPAILAAEELFSHDPLPDPAQLRRMWPMIESRAWAKTRVAQAPSTTRFSATEEDVTITAKQPPTGGFFRMQNIDVHHRRFQGDRSATLNREIFIAVDAAMVLPYDPIRDKVLLVEQVRFGPKMRQDPNPWMLEPVAGIIDARETPEQAAMRETEEEAGLKLRHLVPAGSFYASPGATTDYFYTFVGLCDLPQDAPYFGGLAEEGEDIRLHPVTYDAALQLADSGEIQVGPLLFLLNWLSRHRDRLRTMA
ncbi:gamma-glutamylcyclotransferase [Loktanella sp. S4079]|uniref:gamma-glutamylcyclotransferase n=1 Tax=Loktanella sp. S4079 TaxID=579483 RepID=UPI0005F9CF40|nr:gamma-glutamylcyclotransferase [Loktanella sp. S4079]KJZ20074.1 hypothetical protein TW80_04315 [Loktanella sp. S4079]